MLTISRNEINKHPYFHTIMKLIIKNHVVPEYTIKMLLKNEHVKDFCEESFFYAQLGDDNPLYIGYLACSRLSSPLSVGVQMESLTIYDNEKEYLIEKAKGMHSQNVGSFPERN